MTLVVDMCNSLKIRKWALTVGLPVEMLHVGSPEGRIPSHCRSPDKRYVWYKPCCCPVEHQ